MHGQVSAEMLVLLAVVLGVLAIASTSILGLAHKSGNQISNQTEVIFTKVNNGMKSDSGEACIDDSDCLSGSCVDNVCT